MMERLTIGRAAKLAGVNVETIRFYERRGLIDRPPTPTDGSPREYHRATVERIRFVRQAQQVGFSLSEIADLLSLRTDPGADCADVRARAIEKRGEVQARLERMARICDALDELIASCPGGGDVKACTILEAMARGADLAPALLSPPDVGPKAARNGRHMKTTVLTIEGMHCDGCARTIETLLARLPGVRKVEASFDAREARVLHDPAAVSEADLAAAIDRGGFTARAADR